MLGAHRGPLCRKLGRVADQSKTREHRLPSRSARHACRPVKHAKLVKHDKLVKHTKLVKQAKLVKPRYEYRPSAQATVPSAAAVTAATKASRCALRVCV